MKTRIQGERERRCMVTGQNYPTHRLIRFVLNPEGSVIPDVTGKLPGRGGWILADGKILQRAVKKRIFIRFGKKVIALVNEKKKYKKTQKITDIETLEDSAGEEGVITGPVVKVDNNMPDLVEDLLRQRCLEFLSLANRAGLLISGFDKVRAALVGNKCHVLIMAEDAADNGRRKICSGLGNILDKLRVIGMFSREQLGQALGLSNAVHVALLSGGMTESFLKEFSRYEGVVTR